jgi:hypothetical protein
VTSGGTPCDQDVLRVVAKMESRADDLSGAVGHPRCRCSHCRQHHAQIVHIADRVESAHGPWLEVGGALDRRDGQARGWWRVWSVRLPPQTMHDAVDCRQTRRKRARDPTAVAREGGRLACRRLVPPLAIAA